MWRTIPSASCTVSHFPLPVLLRTLLQRAMATPGFSSARNQPLPLPFRLGKSHEKPPMTASGNDRRAPTTEQLRKAIDSGATGGKVNFPDPAASPLGTDAEAGGAPARPGERAQAYAAEVASRPAAAPARARVGRALPMALGFVALIAISAGLTLLILL